MGQEVDKIHYEKEDYENFQNKLDRETAHLDELFKSGAFEDAEEQFGFELEGWLADSEMNPSPKVSEFIESSKDQEFVPELSKFNFEINSQVHNLNPNLFSGLENELKRIWKAAKTAAEKNNVHCLMIGILPTLKGGKHLTIDNMFPLNRYHALTERILTLRDGKPLHINIEKDDHLDAKRSDIMFEAGATSLQIHTRVSQKIAKRYYNASILAASPMLSIAANSPFFSGKSLWDETRIPLFEQSVSVEGFKSRGIPMPKSVTPGKNYVKESLIELFIENRDFYPILLPMVADLPKEKLHHLKLHNGTIWRWNRPIIGFNEDGSYHLRIEHRTIPSGPSIVDCVANMAFYFGLTKSLTEMETPPESLMPFDELVSNFYESAKNGLNAKLSWIDSSRESKIPVSEIISEKLIPMTKDGLSLLGIDKAEIEYYIDEVIGGRVREMQNGSIWQRKAFKKHNSDFNLLTKQYLENLESGEAVYKWKI